MTETFSCDRSTLQSLYVFIVINRILETKLLIGRNYSPRSNVSSVTRESKYFLTSCSGSSFTVFGSVGLSRMQSLRIGLTRRQRLGGVQRSLSLSFVALRPSLHIMTDGNI